MALVFNGRCLSRPIGGVERYARQLLPLLARIDPGMRVVVPPHEPAFGLGDGLVAEPFGHLGGHAWEQFDLPRAPGPHDALISPANTAPLRAGRQAVVVHDLAFLHHPEWFRPAFARWYRWLVPRLVQRATTVITVSEAMRGELLQAYAPDPAKVFVVPPHAQAPPEGDGKPCHVPRPFVLLVGHDDPRKAVVPALDLLHAAAPGLHAVVVGRERRPFRRAARPPDPRVTWLGPVDDLQLHWLYRHARALLHPSLYEGFGLTVLEALQRGCPVVARPLPVIREAFGDEVHACTFTGSDDLSAVLARLPARGTEALADRSPAAGTFTGQRTTDALRSAIDHLLRS
jgi:glycosyltransferase involved in cell wall biosynthesis